jgi:hypothetical protein
MKKNLAYGLAALLAAGTMTAVSNTASAKPMWMYSHPPMMKMHRHHRIHPGATFFFSTPLLFGFGFDPQFYPYRYQTYGVSPHVQWCLNRYRTYNPATNLFFIKKGVPAVCVSPFSY